MAQLGAEWDLEQRRLQGEPVKKGGADKVPTPGVPALAVGGR